MGIYSIKKIAQPKNKGRDKAAGVGIRSAYLRVVGIQVDTEGAGEYKMWLMINSVQIVCVLINQVLHVCLNG